MAHNVCKNWPRTASSLFNSFLTPTVASRSVGLFRTQTPIFFSTYKPLQYPRKNKKRKKDNNMMRGMSALKGKGIHENMRLTVGIKDLLEPVAEDKITPEVGDENHGLWGFFNKDRSLLTRPEDLGNHGRAWTRQELRRKSWDDLHSLWWICLKERNRLATEDVERERLKAGYGEFESRARQDKIRSTMRRIKSVLRERWYNWEDARKLALSDPEIHVTEDGRVQYVPTANQYDSSDAFEEDVPETSTQQENREASPFAEESMPSKEEMPKEPKDGNGITGGMEPIIPKDKTTSGVQHRL